MSRGSLKRLLVRTSPAAAAARTLAGAAVLSLVPLAMAWPSPNRSLGASIPDLPWLLAESIALALPFTVIIGAATVRIRNRRQAGMGLGFLALLALSVYLLIAEVGPRQEYGTRARLDPERVDVLYPLGPLTPSTLATIRARVVADPPERYSFSTEHPLESSPNWLTYRIQEHGVFAMLAVLNGLLGWAVASRTRRFRRRKRVWLLWTLGIGTALLFFNVAVWTGRWVRQDVSAPGGLYAWAPLVLWLVAITIAWPRRPGGVDET